MVGSDRWAGFVGAAVTVADASGAIVYMNDAALRIFCPDGKDMTGASVFDCHPEPARTRLMEIWSRRQPNHYTIRKRGVRKIIHQMPLFDGGVFSGFVEISMPIPDEIPHRERG